MFAPEIARPQAKTAESSAGKPGSQIETASKNCLRDPAPPEGSASHASWLPPFPPHELLTNWHIGLAPLTEQRTNADALSPPLQQRMEARICASLGGVTLHRGPVAERATAALGARAFTYGRNIVLGAGIDPAAPQAFPLLAHEAAHVVQQSGARADDMPSVTRAGDAAEREADAAALGHVRPAPARWQLPLPRPALAPPASRICGLLSHKRSARPT